MTMRETILAVLRDGQQPVTSEAIIEAVHERSGIGWKGSSIRKALGVLVSRGTVRNLDRDPDTGYYRRIPCRYELAS